MFYPGSAEYRIKTIRQCYGNNTGESDGYGRVFDEFRNYTDHTSNLIPAAEQSIHKSL